MQSPLVQCPRCQAWLFEGVFNRPESAPCPTCGAPLQIEVFPALFRPPATGNAGEAVMLEGESSCFYHPTKKAVVPCAGCGRFLCALCDCELHGEHLCPACLEAGRKKGRIERLTDVRELHQRQAIMLAFAPLFLSGLAAIYLAIRYWKAPDSLVSSRRWAMPVALAVGILQTLLFVAAFILISHS